MRVKNLDHLEAIRQSTYHVIDEIVRLLGVQYARERVRKFQNRVETTNNLIKRYLEKNKIKRTVAGGSKKRLCLN